MLRHIPPLPAPQALQMAGRASRAPKPAGMRVYTSRYRGVHQTFPTRRWEAQFRRNGKPTSLGERAWEIQSRGIGAQAASDCHRHHHHRAFCR